MGESPDLNVPPFEGTKEALWEHLRTLHRTPYSFNSKTSKDDLISWHERTHAQAAGEEGDARWQDEAKRHITTAHIHTAVTVENIKALGGKPLDLDTPLKAGEAKALSEVIDNDFNALRQDMRALADDEKRSRVEAVTKEWDAKGDKSDQWRRDALKLVSNFSSERDHMIAAAKADGIALTIPSVRESYSNVQTELVGKQEAIKKVKQDVDNDLNRALIALERQRLSAQRTVILARITPEAQTVLDTIPKAKTLMVEAAQERAAQDSITQG